VAKQKSSVPFMMASHRRRGARALLIGNEAQKVLPYSSIPVLVYF